MAHILIVDADESFRSACLNDLGEEGHDVLTAATAFEALRLVEERVPDVVITEVRLPGMDGLDLMARLLAKHRGIRVILNSASAYYKDNFLSWVADVCLTKSSGTRELRQRLRELLDSGSCERP